MSKTINKKRLFILILVIVMIIIIGGLYYLLLINHLFSIPCLFYKTTGYYCPGCGITRVFISLIKFDFYQAFRYNPLVFCMLPFFIVYGFITLKNWIYDNKNIKVDDKIWYILLVLTIVFGVLRNTSLFSYLAPTVV